MALSIERLVLDNFRGYRHLELDDLSNLNIVVGKNAVGKTNIIEAIQLLTSADSFRKPSWSETISWNCSSARVYGKFTDENKSIVEHELLLEGNTRTYKVNGKKRNASQVRGCLPSVLFTPDDLQMVKASSSKRRDALDALGVQISEQYLSMKKEYAKALKQRNLLIRDQIHSGFLFDSWDEATSIYGARVCISRMRLFNRMKDAMKSIYTELFPDETFDMTYRYSWKRFGEQERQVEAAQTVENEDIEEVGVEEVQSRLRDASNRLSQMELKRGTSLVGPQKDEIVFYINGKNARMFASQGQQRTCVLVWKLAEVEVVKNLMECNPVLLLDDVMSELDTTHRQALSSRIETVTQAFVTTTNLDYFFQSLLERCNVITLPIEGSKYI